MKCPLAVLRDREQVGIINV